MPTIEAQSEAAGAARNPINLDALLEASIKGQWSLHDFDWSQPVRDSIARTSRQRRTLGRLLLMTAGFERLGVDAFMIHAKYTDNEKAKAVFQLIALDEQRHADAEVELAGRLGMGWKDLPRSVRFMFKLFARDSRRMGRGAAGKLLHEFGASGIPVAELALDTLLLPALKKMSDDPLLTEAFKLIDRDEARHIAMDYWLLEEKGLRKASEKPKASQRRRKGKFVFNPAALAAAVVGLVTFAWSVRDSALEGEDFAAYWDRVLQVPAKAPHAMDVASFRNTIKFFEKAVDFFSERRALFSAFLFLATGRTD